MTYGESVAKSKRSSISSDGRFLINLPTHPNTGELWSHCGASRLPARTKKRRSVRYRQSGFPSLRNASSLRFARNSAARYERSYAKIAGSAAKV